MTTTTDPKPYSLTIFREAQPPPFDHKFQLKAIGCDCAWVCRSIDAAMRLVNIMEFHVRHPELPLPDGAVRKHIVHRVRALILDGSN